MNKINHRSARKMIQARLSLALPQSKGEILDRHLSSCRACQAYASRMQELETGLRQELRANGRIEMTSTPETTRIVLNKLRVKSLKTKIRTVARAAVVSAGVLLMFLLLSTPPGRAWAQNAAQGALRFFTRSESDTIPAPTEVPLVWVEQTPGVPAVTPTPVPIDTLPGFSNECLIFNRPKCSVEQIRDKVDFPVKELGIIPPGMVFVGANGEPDHVYLLYDTPNKSGSIVLFQGRWTGGAIQAGGEISVDAAVESVLVGDHAAEYVKGAFKYEDGKPVYWDDDALMQHLRWVEDDVYIVMQIWSEPYGQPFDRDGVVALAESLTTMPVAALITPEMIDHTPTPDPYDQLINLYPLTVAEAEEKAGFVVQAPSILPEFLLFSGARYDQELNAVLLFYHYNYPNFPNNTNGLTVTQEMIPSEGEFFLRSFVVGDRTELDQYPPGTVVEAIEEVQIRGIVGQYVEGTWSGTESCGWIWDDDPYLKRLRWQANGMAYELSYMGLEVTKEDLITIAESMKAIPMAARATSVPEPTAATSDPAEDTTQYHFQYQFLTVGEAEEAAGFKIAQPSQLPPDLPLLGANFSSERNIIFIYYGNYNQWGAITNSLLLRQQIIPPGGEYDLGGFTVKEGTKIHQCPPSTVVGAVEEVQIGEIRGQYAEGIWSETDQGWAWEDEPYLKRLRWQANGMAYELAYMGLEITKEDLIAIAESMK